mmetsp:Transcript_6929/g.13265  ORF Transcript_6929/g.13265 Transcript_6929/m.13265 type:complete len:366 (+) Transcript_6929:25-1122(+)
MEEASAIASYSRSGTGNSDDLLPISRLGIFAKTWWRCSLLLALCVTACNLYALYYTSTQPMSKAKRIHELVDMISTDSSQVLCILMSVANRFDPERSHTSRHMPDPGEPCTSYSSHISVSSAVVGNLHVIAYLLLLGGVLLRLVNEVGAYMNGFIPSGVDKALTEGLVVIAEAAIRAIPVLMLLASCRGHLRHLDDFVQDVQFGDAKTSANRARDAYKRLRDKVKETDHSWRWWLLAISLSDFVVILCEILRVIVDQNGHVSGIYALFLLDVSGIVAQTLYCGALVLPVAYWNDAFKMAREGLRITDENFTGLSTAYHLMEARRCKLRVAGVSAMTRKGIGRVMLSLIIGPIGGIFLRVALRIHE